MSINDACVVTTVNQFESESGTPGVTVRVHQVRMTARHAESSVAEVFVRELAGSVTLEEQVRAARELLRARVREVCAELLAALETA